MADKTILSKFEGDFSKELRHHLSDLVNEELSLQRWKIQIKFCYYGFVQDCLNSLNKKTSCFYYQFFELS